MFDPDPNLDCLTEPGCGGYASQFFTDTARDAFFGYYHLLNLVGTGLRGGVGCILPDNPLEVATSFFSSPNNYRQGLDGNGQPYVDSSGNPLSPWLNPLIGDTTLKQSTTLPNIDKRIYAKTTLGTLAPGQSTCFNTLYFYTKVPDPDIRLTYQAYVQMADYLNAWWDGISVTPCQQVGLDQEELIQEAFTVRVYPNPSKGSFTIDGPEGSSYTVVDLTGKVLREGTLVQNRTAVALNAPSGMYILKVQSGQQTSVHKVLLQP